MILRGFVYYLKYDAFPETPNAEPPPPFQETQRRLDREFYDSLGPERTGTSCKRDGCPRGRIEQSVFCGVHHFEMVKKRTLE